MERPERQLLTLAKMSTLSTAQMVPVVVCEKRAETTSHLFERQQKRTPEIQVIFCFVCALDMRA
jgi:hypothetical protein